MRGTYYPDNRVLRTLAGLAATLLSSLVRRWTFPAPGGECGVHLDSVICRSLSTGVIG